MYVKLCKYIYICYTILMQSTSIYDRLETASPDYSSFSKHQRRLKEKKRKRKKKTKKKRG